jgi:hypothetical protein
VADIELMTAGPYTPGMNVEFQQAGGDLAQPDEDLTIFLINEDLATSVELTSLAANGSGYFHDTATLPGDAAIAGGYVLRATGAYSVLNSSTFAITAPAPTTFAIRPNGGGDAIRMRTIIGAINTALATNDVVINCYKGGDVVGPGSSTLVIYATDSSRHLTINFVDRPADPLKYIDMGVVGNRQLCTFASNNLTLRVANCTVNNWWARGAELVIESNTVGDNDPDTDDPLNNGGPQDVVATINNAVCWGGAFVGSINGGAGTLDLTMNNTAITDGPVAINAAGGTLTLHLEHHGSYGGDSGIMASTDTGATIVVTAKDSVFCGARGLFVLSSDGGATVWGGSTHTVTPTNCIPAAAGDDITAYDETLVGVPFVVDPQPPQPGASHGDLTLSPTSPLIDAGGASALVLDFTGRSRTTLAMNSKGPIEPLWRQAAGAGGADDESDQDD